MSQSSKPRGQDPPRRDRLIREREHDTYKVRGQLPDPTACPECGAMYRAGRWTWGSAPVDAQRVVCPACQRIKDDYPGGFLTLGGSFALARHIIFTGGTHIGRYILQAAAENLTPCTLELGGKSPVIISRSYDIKKAAERIMLGKALNQGQACLGPDYCFVPKEKMEEFTSHS